MSTDLMIRTLSFGVAALCVGLMGFAIQRGATCAVAAVDEVVHRRGATRLIALVEASAWVTGGILVALHFGWLAEAPTGFELSGWTIAGACLLGLGAFVNQACVFGAVARFGSGEWGYAATPLGFYLGCVAATHWCDPMPRGLVHGSIVLEAPVGLIGLLAAVLSWRVVKSLIAHRAGQRPLVGRHLWSPHVATSVIGVTFLATLLLVGAWAYTDALADVARGMSHDVVARTLLLVCLLGGAMLGGWTAGRFRPVPVSASVLLRCLCGGLLMGWGSAFVPGGNDGLILIGMPLLWPYAWVAFVTMCVSIASAMWLEDRVRARQYGAVVPSRIEP